MFVGLLLAAVVAPTPQPELKTIVTVHSSQFCTALSVMVRPALVGLMRNDQLIGLGQSTLRAGDREVKFGGQSVSSFGQNASTWVPNSGEITMLNNRQRQLAIAMQQNIATIDSLLTNPKAPTPSGEDAAKLASIKAQLGAILGKQRTASNIIAGNADTSELANVYNDAAYSPIDDVRGGASGSVADLNGISATDARATDQHNNVKGAGATTDPTTASQNAISQAADANTFDNPYAKLAHALELDQGVIQKSEDTVSKSIVDAVAECQ